jgi:hypothetical protein
VPIVVPFSSPRGCPVCASLHRKWHRVRRYGPPENARNLLAVARTYVGILLTTCVRISIPIRCGHRGWSSEETGPVQNRSFAATVYSVGFFPSGLDLGKRE